MSNHEFNDDLPYEPKTTTEYDLVDYDKVDPALLEMQAELYKSIVLDNLVYGIKAGQGFGKGYRAAEKIREQTRANFPVPVINSLDNGRLGTGILTAKVPTTLPPKICGYRKPKLYWFGELHSSNNLVHNPAFMYNSDGFTSNSVHWKIDADKLTIKGRDPKDGLSVFFEEYAEESLEMANSFEKDPFKGRRFIGISEVTESEQIDNDFLKRFTGDAWVETRTLDASSNSWVPQGELFIGGSKPLKINEKSKETLEQVERIEYP